MTNNKTNKPLYQLLNEQRTQGEWKVRNSPFLPSSWIEAEKDICRMDETENEKANAQYTALAVNNLASLAEALERAMRIIERLSDEYREAVNKHSSYTNGEFKILSEALNRIK